MISRYLKKMSSGDIFITFLIITLRYLLTLYIKPDWHWGLKETEFISAPLGV